MTSLLDVMPVARPDDQVGCQSPRILSTPRYRRIETGRWNGQEDVAALAYRSPAGQEAVDLAESSGLHLDRWQQLALHHSLAEDDAGRWESFEVCLNVPRQNGKGGYLEARQLAGVLLFGDELVIHTAHEFKTARESFRRLDRIIEGSRSLRRRVKRVIRSHGEEGFEFFSGARILFLARSGGSGRGFSGDLVIMDEAMKLGIEPIGALLPTMSARRNPQLVYGCSAGLGGDSEHLATLRARALAGTEDPDASLSYLEWSIDQHVKECARDDDRRLTCTDHDDLDNVQSWGRANPAMGIRIRPSHIRREMGTMGDLFDRERLGVGDYPAVVEETWKLIPEEDWRALADPGSRPTGRIAFAADINPERTAGSIAVAARREDGRLHTEVIQRREGTGWMVPYLLERVDKWEPCALVIDGAGPAGALIAQLEAVWEKRATEGGGVRPAHHEVVRPTGRDVAQAYGQWRDAVAEDQLRYLPHPALDAAVAGAKERSLGEAKALTRTASSVDISPLVATTLAAWGHMTRAHLEPDAPPNLW
ncbi:terminase [Streptomyces sp. NBC_01262]|uniref:terminase n=1 Tax=Streptomyces sp. NBC_01262 TaxID=2903803 RepID=UPI002E32F5B0|nr:terminase [Streptomyces sp. NBC_01262]